MNAVRAVSWTFSREAASMQPTKAHCHVRSLPSLFRQERHSQRQRPGGILNRSFFSTDAHEKLLTILEEYRKANYSQTIPSRFVKKVLAATDEDGDGRISVKEVQRLLKNIGAADRMSQEELQTIMMYLGCYNVEKQENMSVPLEEVRDLFLGKKK